MAEMTWEKTDRLQENTAPKKKNERVKFLIGGVVLLIAVAFMVINATVYNTRYFMSVDELVNNPDRIGETVRISGAVIGETIAYDSENLMIDFTIANIPSDTTDLATTLHEAVLDTGNARLQVHIENEVMPDLLQHEAQAILSGELGDDGVFYASELLLKCPSRYQENVPAQVNNSDSEI